MKRAFVFLLFLAIIPQLYAMELENSHLIPRELQSDVMKPLLEQLVTAVEKKDINDIKKSYDILKQRLSKAESNPYLKRPLAYFLERISVIIAPLIGYFENNRTALESLAPIFANSQLYAQFQDALNRSQASKPVITPVTTNNTAQVNKNGHAAKKPVVRLSNKEIENLVAKAREQAEKTGDFEELFKLKDMPGISGTDYVHRINDALDRLLSSDNSPQQTQQKPVTPISPAAIPVLPQQPINLPGPASAKNSSASSPVIQPSKESEQIDELILKASNKAEQSGDFSDLLQLLERSDISGTSYAQFINDEMHRIVDGIEAKQQNKHFVNQPKVSAEPVDDSFIFAQVTSALETNTIDVLFNALETLPSSKKFQYSYKLLTDAIVNKAQGDMKVLLKLLEILNKNTFNSAITQEIAALIETIISPENNNSDRSAKEANSSVAAARQGKRKKNRR